MGEKNRRRYPKSSANPRNRVPAKDRHRCNKLAPRCLREGFEIEMVARTGHEARKKGIRGPRTRYDYDERRRTSASRSALIRLARGLIVSRICGRSTELTFLESLESIAPINRER